MVKIMDMPKHKRPRERLLEFGATNLKDKELLAIILRVGSVGKNAIELAGEIINKITLEKLFYLNLEELLKIKGIDTAKASAILASFELAKRALKLDKDNLPIISSVQNVADQLTDIRVSKKENFIALYLNARNQLVYKEKISIGTINASLVHPREVFAPAIKHLAVGIILAHNHPSGSCEPSDNDIEVTKRLVRAGEVMGVEILDHIIITEDNFLSLKELSLI